MSEKSKLFFNGKKKVIGMVHLLPLPGNAAYQNNKEEIVKNAIEDALTLIDCGVDAIMLENFSHPHPRVLQDPVRRQHRDERLRAGVGHGLRRRRRLHPL